MRKIAFHYIAREIVILTVADDANINDLPEELFDKAYEKVLRYQAEWYLDEGKDKKPIEFVEDDLD